MDLRQIEHFVTVAAEQSFTRAAQRLNIVQSGLSASIRTLEEELGAPLLLRTTRRVDLTAIGRAFLVEARHVLAAANEARQVVAQMISLQRGTLSIGAIPGLAPLINIPELLGQFCEAHPCIEIRLISDGSLRLIDGVRTGEFDLAFTQFVGRTPPGIRARMLAREPLVAVCATGHALAGRPSATLRDLVAETFVELRRDWGVRQLIDQSFSESRLTRKIGFEVNDLDTQLDLVGHGLGIALVPKAMIRGNGVTQIVNRLGVVELSGPGIYWKLAAVFAQDEAHQPVGMMTRTFLEFLRAPLTLLDEPKIAESYIAMAG